MGVACGQVANFVWVWALVLHVYGTQTFKAQPQAHTTVHGLHILEHNKYMYIARLNHLFTAVRVAKLYTHAVDSASSAQKVSVQISPVQKKTVVIFDLLKMDGRADGNQKKKDFPHLLGRSKNYQNVVYVSN